jgi:hypothetical protein
MHKKTRHFSQAIITLLLSYSILPTGNAQLLQSGFESTYEVYHNTMYLGDTVRKLSRKENGEWLYHASTKAKGLAGLFFKDKIEERSMLTISLNGIRPMTYRYDQTGGKKDKHIKLDFYWDKNELFSSDLNKDIELLPGTQDLLSFVLQIMHEMQANKQTIDMPIADKDSIDQYQLKVIGKETIETPFKSLPTIVLLSNKIKGKKQFKFWCAPSLQYLPIRIMKIDDDGDEDTLSLSKFNLLVSPTN